MTSSTDNSSPITEARTASAVSNAIGVLRCFSVHEPPVSYTHLRAHETN